MKKINKKILNNAFAMAAYNMLARKAIRENLSDEEFKKLVKDFLETTKTNITKNQKGKQNEQN